MNTTINIINNMSEKITIPRRWLERLLELGCKCTTEKNKLEWVNLLLGYIESVEFILKK
jgi:hypothetical protein